MEILGVAATLWTATPFTEVYGMNAQVWMSILLPLFDKAEVLTVNHLLKIPAGTTKLQRIPANIRKLKVVGRQGALISTFRKAGHLYMAVVNKDYESDMKLYISARSNVTMLDKQLKETAVKSSYKVGGGDMLLFKLK